MARRTLLYIPLCLALASIAACGPEPVPAGPTTVKTGAKKPYLPAWRLPSEEKIPGKADEFDDYRAAHPELYALTVAPAKPGFRALVEWEPMQALLLSYSGYEKEILAQMVKSSIDVSDIYIVVETSTLKTEMTNAIKAAGVAQTKIDSKVHFLTYPNDSIWMIDFAPVPLVGPDGTIAFADFRYYHDRVNDDALPARLADLWGLTDYRVGMDYEGGNFQMDEVGTCYYSQGTFWENADKTEAEVQELLDGYIGCKKHIVLEPLQDGTTHMDMFSKLVGKNVFVLGKGTSANQTSQSIATLENDFSILSAATLADGTKLTIHRIPMPYQKDGVWRTFTNSTMLNKVNLVPVYAEYDALEAEAMNVWKAALPDWTHVGIDSDTIIPSGGAMHCVSRTIPVGTFTKWVADGTCSGGTCAAPAGGYDGACQGSDDCTGAEHLCELNDCSGTTPVDCGDISWEGCCDGYTLKYCESGLKVQNCQGSGGCGWNGDGGYYDCGFTAADPSGKNPRECTNGTCTPSCTDKECGDNGCGGSCGTCASGKACTGYKCVSCTPACTGKACGDDGCGGSCGTCASGKACDAEGQCVADPCGGIGLEGCCDGLVNKWCEDGKILQEDCSSADPKTCGWAEPGDGYVSGYYCGGSGSDPSGEIALKCPGSTCVPSCTGKVCGSDGCGGSCGTCAAGQACTAGKCVACTADCSGKVCGDDGCGGSCGQCATGQSCNASGQCAASGYPADCLGPEKPSADSCPAGLAYEGCCDAKSRVVYCDEGKLFCIDCPTADDASLKTCGWSANEDFAGYDCGGNGADPSGAFPLACTGSVCTPSCAGKVCGDDGCGGFCGQCAAGETCQAGQCSTGGTDAVQDTPDAACQKDCSGRVCGPDGCGGLCGSCPFGYTCNDSFQCVVMADSDALAPLDTAAGDATVGPVPEATLKGGGCVAGGAGMAPFAGLLLAGLFGLAVRGARRVRRVR